MYVNFFLHKIQGLCLVSKSISRKPRQGSGFVHFDVCAPAYHHEVDL